MKKRKKKRSDRCQGNVKGTGKRCGAVAEFGYATCPQHRDQDQNHELKAHIRRTEQREVMWWER